MVARPAGTVGEVVDRFDLGRFVEAQDDRGTFEMALEELRSGHKASHWMWFIFPQLAGLAASATARHFALSSLEEAVAYLAHPRLGPRLMTSSSALLDLEGRSAIDALGPIDARKLASSMTLFGRAAPDEPVFRAVLDRYFDSATDPLTLALLEQRGVDPPRRAVAWRGARSRGGS